VCDPLNRSIRPRPRVGLAEHCKNAALHFGDTVALDLEMSFVSAAVVGIVDPTGPRIRAARRERIHDLQADQGARPLGGIGIEPVGLGPAGRGIDRVVEPHQRRAQLVAAAR